MRWEAQGGVEFLYISDSEDGIRHKIIPTGPSEPLPSGTCNPRWMNERTGTGAWGMAATMHVCVHVFKIPNGISVML